MRIKFNTIDNVRLFEEEISKLDCSCYIAYNGYVIDAKSIMGIFSLDLLQEMELSIIPNDEDDVEQLNIFINKIKEFGILC